MRGMNFFLWIRSRWVRCAQVDENFLCLLLKVLFFRVRKKRIEAHYQCMIKGVANIETYGTVDIGMRYVGFTHPKDVTWLNVQGKLIFNNSYSIGRGCRFDIGPKAVAEFEQGFVNPLTKFIITEGIRIGNGTVISWNCQFLDNDFHSMSVEKNKKTSAPIEIGNHVWIGCNVTVLKGSVIPSGCVVAAGSVVNKVFNEENVFIGGVPATILKRNISWK